MQIKKKKKKPSDVGGLIDEVALVPTPNYLAKPLSNDKARL